MKKAFKILITITLISFYCSTALAIGMQGTTEVKKSLDLTIEKLEKAVDAFDKGKDQNMVIELLMDAKQIQKSFSTANGNLSMIKSKATQKLGQARSNFNDGNISGGGEALKEALAGFKEFKQKYNTMH